MALASPLRSLHPPSRPPVDPLPPTPAPAAPMPAPQRADPHSTARVLVGPEKYEFVVDRDLLAAASGSFREGLDASARRNKHHHAACIWLADESPAMFGLFAVWLHRRPAAFRALLDKAGEVRQQSQEQPQQSHQPQQQHTPNRTSFASLNRVSTSGNPDADPSNRARCLHWALARLHVFAARLGLSDLQDDAMDGLQDLYLRRDWDVTPALIRFLYGHLGPEAGSGGAAVRLRRWAVAMVAWQLAGGATFVGPSPSSSSSAEEEQVPGQDRDRISDLFGRYPEFAADYRNHVGQMKSSGLDVRIKNPQLRIPANRLRSEERMFAFRQCSFHSHRAAVGEGTCPHLIAAADAAAAAASLVDAQQPLASTAEPEHRLPKTAQRGGGPERRPQRPPPLQATRKVNMSVGATVWARAARVAAAGSRGF